jgi:hypothetical protein
VPLASALYVDHIFSVVRIHAITIPERSTVPAPATKAITRPQIILFLLSLASNSVVSVMPLNHACRSFTAAALERGF